MTSASLLVKDAIAATVWIQVYFCLHCMLTGEHCRDTFYHPFRFLLEPYQ